jgi:hypothetical protein
VNIPLAGLDRIENDAMTEDELFSDLPEDPELAFLHLEKFFRDECSIAIQQLGQNESAHMCYISYISKVLAAISELKLETAFHIERLPPIEDVDYNTYLNFSKDVEHYKTGLRIRHARRNKQYSVKFDPATKQKIRHHLEQIRSLVDKLEINERKKEALFAKINALENEIDRNRTRLEVYAAVVIAAADVFDEASEKAEPARRWLDSIARLIWGTKEREEMGALPPPNETRAIAPPSVQNVSESNRGNDRPDDEIPF